MSNLNATDILLIQKLIYKKTKKKGYVWDFTDATFKDFVNSYTGLDIDDDKYSLEDGRSKMKRLKKFLEIEDDSSVILLLNGIKEYGKKRRLLCKTNIDEIESYIKKLKKLKKSITIDKSIFDNSKRVDLLLLDINEKISKGQYELAIDRLHTLFKEYIEKICINVGIDINGKTLDSLYCSLLKYLHDNNVIKEQVTIDILSSANKVMKSFNYARNNRSFAHSNDIMDKSEADFLCNYIIDLFKFMYNITWKN